MSIFKKIFTRILVSFIALTILLGGLSFYNLKNILTKELINTGKVLSESIADSVALKLAAMDIASFQDLINNYKKIDGIQYIYITNETNELVLDTFSPQPPQEIIDAIKENQRVLPIPSLNSIEIKHGILYGSLGHVHVGMNTDLIMHHLAKTFPLVLIVITIIMALCLWLLRRVIKNVTQPLNTLTNFTKDIERYQFDISKANQHEIKKIAKLNDEIGLFTKNYLTLHQELGRHVEQLTEASARNSAIKKELTIAHDIQMNLLNEAPKITGSNHLTFSPYLCPAKDVGGDFYDVVEKGDTVYVAIGDVSGKGVSAALVMAATLTSIRTSIDYLNDPTDIITTVNKQISKHNPNLMFVSLFFAAININTGIMDYVNAGHPSPFIHTDHTITTLPPTNSPVIGIQEHQYYPSNQAQLTQNSVMIMYTDGVNEAHNEKNELFGDKAIKNVLMELSNPSAKTCTQTLNAALDTFTNGTDPHDDITILSVKFSAKEKEIPNPLVISFNNDIHELIKLQHVTTAFSKQHQLQDKIEKSINLVLEELLSNTIFYGYQDSNPHTIFVRFLFENNTVTIHVEDDAIPFNPLTDAPEVDTTSDISDRPVGGLGVHIIKKMVDDIQYQRINEKNQLTIVKEIS